MAKLPEVSASVLAAAQAIQAEPPTPEQIAGLQGAQVVLPPDSAASAGARGVYDNIAAYTLLRNAGYMEMGLDPNDPSGELTDPDPEAPPGNGNGGGGTDTAPVNTAAPAVTKTGSTLNFTVGVWNGEPTSYDYAWTINGNTAGCDASTYDVQAGDVGQTAICTVTATNAAGSTAAPPSVAVIVV